MFSRYFGDRYFAQRFWPNFGDVLVIVDAEPDVEVIVRGTPREVLVRARVREVVVRP
jgi:hypothetical protein